MTRPNMWKTAFAVLVLCAATAPAQVFTTLVEFNVNIGIYPDYVSLVQGVDGGFYGTTEYGGNTICEEGPYCGTLFKVTSTGTLMTLQLTSYRGSNPATGLILGTDGNFYGTAPQGGTHNSRTKCESGCGTVFKVTPYGRFTHLYNFCANGPPYCTDGTTPIAQLLQLPNGSFYGMTTRGGGNGYGTVFKLAPDGTLTTIYSFCTEASCADGVPGSANGLILGRDGNLYGVTEQGGSPTCGCGTVFKMTLAGALTILHTFEGPDGYFPVGGLVQANDGTLYGTTSFGGNLTCANPYGCGTVFSITQEGDFGTLHTFNQMMESAPTGTLIIATDGNLYGTTTGGEYYLGSIFKLSRTGAFTDVHDFDRDGFDPQGGLLQATDGDFYGTTRWGGDYTCDPQSGCGTIFRLSMGLGPFVSFVHNPAKVGQPFGVLGQGLTGTTSVSLNGTPASFTVVSDTFMKATVPAGATTGYVTVTTPGGTLTSNVSFHVIP